MSNVQTARWAARQSRLLVAVVVLALPLAGCFGTVDRTVPTGSVPDDFHLRHRVVLANAPEYLDIFMVGPSGRLDSRQRHDVQAFAEDYRVHGQGGIAIEVPHGPVDEANVQRTLDAVRHTLADFGVRDRVQVTAYPVSDPRIASPLHMRYFTLQARGASHCGDWPDDLNSGASTNGWENRTYYNLGCGTTQTLAAQLDDPRDLLRPRAEDPSDVQMRTFAIGQLRLGKDPSTVWSGSSLQPITAVGGQ